VHLLKFCLNNPNRVSQRNEIDFSWLMGLFPFSKLTLIEFY
jgi:hypothetical protein